MVPVNITTIPVAVSEPGQRRAIVAVNGSSVGYLDHYRRENGPRFWISDLDGTSLGEPKGYSARQDAINALVEQRGVNRDYRTG